jgi:hypothetical protein
MLALAVARAWGWRGARGRKEGGTGKRTCGCASRSVLRITSGGGAAAGIYGTLLSRKVLDRHVTVINRIQSVLFGMQNRNLLSLFVPFWPRLGSACQ